MKITVVTQLCNTCLDFSCLVTLVVKTHTVAFSVYFFYSKAIKFYIHDLCVNPARFDAWAGMALARSSRLEQRLNSVSAPAAATCRNRMSSAHGLSINVNVVIRYLFHRRFLYSHKINGIHAVVEKMRPTSTLESISQTARYCVLSS